MTAIASRPGADAPLEPPHLREPRRLPESWPLWVGVAGFPVAWALGVTPVLFPLLAIPMAWRLVRRPGGVRFPPGFGIWALFLAWVLASAVALNLQAPGTLPPSGTGRYFAYAVRFADYCAMTIFMLYVGNADPRRLSMRTVMSAISALCVGVVSLGVLAVLIPRGAFHSPLAGILPASMLPSDAGGESGLLRLSQVQDVLGYSAPRPAAPFVYTNAWGNSFSLLIVWLVVRFGVGGSARAKALTATFCAIAMVPVIYSLNRGLWIGLVLSVAYVVLRLALRGRVAVVAVAVAGVALLGAGVAVSPLGATIASRVDNGHSNQIRESLASGSLRAMKASPIIGYGSTRATQGSASSIAVGKTKDCPKCGNRNIGSTGQLWLLLISQGLIGTLLYFGFFLRVLWVYRRDVSPVGIAGSLVILLSFFYALFYTALLIPLCITFLSVGLLWRNAMERRARAEAVPPRPQEAAR
jgi:hypothetical protein